MNSSPSLCLFSLDPNRFSESLFTLQLLLERKTKIVIICERVKKHRKKEKMGQEKEEADKKKKETDKKRKHEKVCNMQPRGRNSLNNQFFV
jgi:hypothetical protein